MIDALISVVDRCRHRLTAASHPLAVRALLRSGAVATGKQSVADILDPDSASFPRLQWQHPVDDPRLMRSMRVPSPHQSVFSRDGESLLSFSQNAVDVIDLGTFDRSRSIALQTISPIGERAIGGADVQLGERIVLTKHGSRAITNDRPSSVASWDLTGGGDHHILKEWAPQTSTCALSATGGILYTGATDGTVAARSASTGDLLHLFEPRIDETVVHIEVGDEHVAALGRSTVATWTLGGRLVGTLNHAEQASQDAAPGRSDFPYAFGGRPCRYLVGDEEGNLLIWPLGDPGALQRVHVASTVSSLAVSGDGLSGVVGCEDGSVSIIRLADGAVVASAQVDEFRVDAVAGSSDLSTVLVFSRGAVTLWEVATDRRTRFSSSHLQAIRQVVVTKDSRLAVVTTMSALIRLDLQTHEVQVNADDRFTHWHAQTMDALDGARVALIDRGQSPVILDASAGGLPERPTVLPITAVAVTPDGTIAFTGHDNGSLSAWALDGWPHIVWQQRAAPLRIEEVATSGSGRYLITRTQRRQATVWRRSKHGTALEQVGDLGEIDGFALAHLSELAFIATGSVVSRVDLEALQPTEFSRCPGTQVTAIGWSPDDSYVGIGRDDGRVELRSSQGGPSWVSPRWPAEITSLAIAQDLRVVAGCYDGSVGCWDPTASSFLLGLAAGLMSRFMRR